MLRVSVCMSESSFKVTWLTCIDDSGSINKNLWIRRGVGGNQLFCMRWLCML